MATHRETMTEVINKQRQIAIDTSVFAEFAEKAIGAAVETNNRHAAIAFVSDRKMREFNKGFRGKNQTTDVLSFPYELDDFEPDEAFLGDIVISLEQAAKQAAENGLNLETEVKQLILHGILHLCGFDHENDDGEMNRRELELRDKLNI